MRFEAALQAAYMYQIRELTTLSALLRIAVALVVGGVIGLERGVKNRPAGMRTYMLVCLGACVVMITNQYVSQAYGTGDPVRMGAQVISGIGFLGAGTIIVTARNQIKGLTTAAGLWAAACVSLAIGIGLFEIAIPACIAIFLVLTALHKMDARVRKATRMADVYVELDKKTSLGKFMRFTRDNGIETSNLQMEHEDGQDHSLVAFIVTVKGQKHSEIVELLRTMDGVRYIDEL